MSPKASSVADTHINSLSNLDEDIKGLKNHGDISMRCSPSKSTYTGTTNNYRHTRIDTLGILEVDYSIF